MTSAASTIVALATPVGVSGIAVLRLSGSDVLRVATLLTGLSGAALLPRRATFSPLNDASGQEIDRGLVTFFSAPHSYTGEDVVEISCHGGRVVPQRILHACLALGCRAAAPGEFTRRAFLNGRLDLAQAEAVAETIAASTALSQDLSYRILSGKLSARLQAIRKSLQDIVGLFDAELDFTDQEVSLTPSHEKVRRIDGVLAEVRAMVNSYKTGRLFREGAVVVIVGATNVGKSSLLNALIEEERVIVSDVPGTTRDAVEVSIELDGVPVRLVDTAGLRDSDVQLERLGMGFSRSWLARADLVLWVGDATILETLEIRDNILPDGVPYILLINKIDLFNGQIPLVACAGKTCVGTLRVSAISGNGLPQLKEQISWALLGSARVSDSEIVLTSARHHEVLSDAEAFLKEARDGVASSIGDDAVAFSLRGALAAIDRILGVTTADDILDNIFSKFCIGK